MRSLFLSALLVGGSIFISACKESQPAPRPLPPPDLPGSWSSASSMSTATKEIANSSVLVDGKIWIMGGVANNSISNSVMIYDIANDSWEQGPELITPVWRTAAAAIGNRIYVFGGYTSLASFPFSPINSCYSIAIDDSEWTEIAPMPTMRGASVAIATSNTGGDQIHVIGGGAVEAFSTHQAYNPQADSWTALSAMPGARAGLTGVNHNGDIYILGGYFFTGSVVPNPNLFRYNQQTEIWEELSSLPEPRLGMDAVAFNDKIIVFGGGVQSPLSISNSLQYDITSDSWLQLQDMPTPVSFMAVEVFDETIYVMGGGATNLNRIDAVALTRVFSPED